MGILLCQDAVARTLTKEHFFSGQSQPMIALSKSIRKHFYGIINSIILGVSNGRAKSINSKIQKIKKMACRFRNVERFKNSILFHLGGLELYPN